MRAFKGGRQGMYTKPLTDGPDDMLVCHCGGVTKKMLLEAIRDGHVTFERIKKVTGACPDDNDCARNNPSGRCCGPDIIALLKAARSGGDLPDSCGTCCQKPA